MKIFKLNTQNTTIKKCTLMCLTSGRGDHPTAKTQKAGIITNIDFGKKLRKLESYI